AKEAATKARRKAAKRVREAQGKVGDLVIKMTVDSISMRTSFGTKSPVFQRYRELSRSFTLRYQASAPTPEGRIQREAAEEGGEVKKTQVALNAFQEACEEWAVQQRTPTHRLGWLTRKLQRH